MISAAFDYEPHYCEVFGSRMHYIDEGSGDPILLLHGNPTWSYLWRNIIPHLREKGRVIAPDLIGMGRSDKPDIDYRFVDHARYLETFIETLGLRHITLVIHDWGSVLGFHYAARHEANVKGIAFMEANILPRYSWDEFDPQTRETFRRLRTPDIGWDLAVNQNMFIEMLLPGATKRQLSDEEMTYYREPFIDPASRKPLWRWPNELPIAGEPPDVFAAVEAYNHCLQQSNLPKLLLYVTPGAVITAPVVDWCRQHLPNLQTVYLGEGIHFIQEDYPDQIGQAVSEWITTIL
jgi:haloalkane dehalogenase